MQHSIVEIKQLSHQYTTARWAVKDLDLNIRHHGIVGLLGSNGAGKSTVMNILCGALNPTKGEVYINGIHQRENPKEAKAQIGFLPQQPPLYLDLTVQEYLAYCAALRQIPGPEQRRAIEEVKERCAIGHFSSRLIKNLSGGYRQRVGIAQAIIHKPRVVVLDEPTNGLDPNQIIEVRALIREIATDRLVIFSSHVLSEVQLLCRDITMIEDGKIVFSNTMDAFNNYVLPHSVVIHFENMPAMEELTAIAGVTRTELLTERQVRVFFNGDQDITETIVETSVQNRWRLREITLDKNALEEIFKQLSQPSSL